MDYTDKKSGLITVTVTAVSSYHRQHHYQQGFTLIEVIVSMFILALGIMGLIGMQVRTLNSVTQAENILQVSQAVDNLAQGLSIAPYLKIRLTGRGYVTDKDYSAFSSQFKQCPAAAVADAAPAGKNNLTQMAAFLGSRFCQEISQIKGIRPQNLQIKICPNATMDATLAWDFSCNKNGNQTIIKVVWKYQNNYEKQNPVLGNNLINNHGETVLSYQVPLAH